MITNNQLYKTIENVLDNIQGNELDSDVIHILESVFNSKTEEISVYILHYDDNTSDYENVADAMFGMINGKKVLNYTVVSYSDLDIGVIAVITERTNDDSK